MLGKLLKYEFRATARVFLPFFGALIVVSFISRLLGSFTGSGSNGAAYIIGVVLSVVLMAAVVVVAFVLMIQRFSKNLIGDEGYLMFTLPASTDSLIFSKIITSAAWNIASVVVVLISIAIMSLTDLGFIASQIGQFLKAVFTGGAGDILASFLAVIFVISSLFTSILSFYMCISLSMLFNRRRGLISVGLYVLYVIIMQVLGALCLMLPGTQLAKSLLGWVGNMTQVGAINVMLLGMILLTFIWGGAMYLVTRYMLSRKLNLE